MGKIISVINMKGGVGKTTLSVGLADVLAMHNYSVLLIDADPQFNATQAMLDTYRANGYADIESESNFYNEEILKTGKTIYKLFKPQIDMMEAYATPKAEDLLVKLTDKLDLLCGDLNLVLVNKVSDHTFVRRIKNFIDDNKLYEKYDFIIIDCPPTLTIYTDSALMASDYYLIPNRIDRYSIVGIDSLQKAVENLIREERIPLKCIGLVYTMVSTDLSVKQKRIKDSFENKKTVNNIDIFDSRSTIVNDIQCGKAGTLPTKYKKSKEDMEAIAAELLTKIKNDQERENRDV